MDPISIIIYSIDTFYDTIVIIVTYICITIYLRKNNKIFNTCQVVVLLHFMRRQLLYEKITISVVGKCVFFEGLLVLFSSDVPKES